MIQSMTGFGSSTSELDDIRIDLKIKTLNHRFLEIRHNLNMDLSYLEPSLNQQIKKHIKRGRVDLHLNISKKKGSACQVQLDKELLRQYMNAAQTISTLTGNSIQGNSWDLLNIKDILILNETENSSIIKNLFEKSLKTALDELLSMRKKEGKNLKKTLLDQLKELKSFTEFFSKFQKDRPTAIKERVLAKVDELKESFEIDPGRLHQELIYYLEKQDITEEINRLGSHILQFKTFLQSKDCRGKKLDFLLQEMQREVNTIGSKSGDVKISEKIVQAKFAIEQMKEQIQNLE